MTVASYDGTSGNTIEVGDAGLGGQTLGGTIAPFYTDYIGGFHPSHDSTGEFGQQLSTAACYAIRSWVSGDATVWTWGQVRFPFVTSGGVGPFLRARQGSTTLAQAYTSINGYIKIAGTTAQGEQDDLSDRNFANGGIYNYMWKVARNAGTQDLWIWRDGYFGHLSGSMGTTAGAWETHEGVVSTVPATGFVAQFKNTDASTSSQPTPAAGLLISDRPCKPEVDGFDVVLQTDASVDHVKVEALTMAGASVFTTTGVVTGANDWTTVTVSDGSLDSFTWYRWQAYGSINGGGAYNPIGMQGTIRTRPVEDVAVSAVKIALPGCELSPGTLTHHGRYDRRAWDHLMNEFRPDYQIQTGDEDYSNEKVNTSGSAFRAATSDTLVQQTGCQDAYRTVGQLARLFSDHDGGTGNGGFNEPGIIGAKAAFLETTSPYAIPSLGGSLADKGTPGTVIIGRYGLVWTDFRTNGRSDPEAVESGTKYGFPPEQVTWWKGVIDGHIAAGRKVIFMNDVPWVGLPEDQDEPGGDDDPAKLDHMARYQTQRADIDVFLFARRFSISGTFGDYHGGAMVGRSATRHPCGIPWFCMNGTQSESGNVRDEQNYDETSMAPSQAPGKTKIDMYTQMILHDDSEGQWVEFFGIDAADPTNRLTYADHFLDEPDSGRYPLPSITVGRSEEEAATGGAELNVPPQSYVEFGTSLEMLPAKDVATATVRGIDGVFESDDVDSGPAFLQLQVAFAADTEAQTRLLIRNWLSVFGAKKLVYLGYAPDQFTLPEWTAACRQVTSVQPEWFAPNAARVKFTPYVPSGKWRSTIVQEWSAFLDEEGFGGTIITPLRGWAPIDDAIWRVTGPADFIRVTDQRSLSWFRWTIPGVTKLLAGEHVIIDSRKWTAHVVTTDTWDTSDGTLIISDLRHGGPGSSLITLTGEMAKAVPSDPTVRIVAETDGGTAGVTKIEVRARDATYVPW